MNSYALNDSSEKIDWYTLIVKLRAEYELEQLTWPVPQGRRYARRQTHYRNVTTEALLDSMRRILRGNLSTALGMFGRRLWSGISTDDEINMMLKEFIRRGCDRERFAWTLSEYER